MKNIYKIVSFVGLCLTIIPAVLVMKGVFTLNNHKDLMLIGMVLWFVTAPLWMKSKPLEEEKSE